MLSLRAKIAIYVMKKSLNFNPITLEERNMNLIDAFNEDVLKKTENKKLQYNVPKGYTLDKLDIDGLPLEIFKNENIVSSKVVYVLHGGAYILGLSSLYRFTNKPYNKATNGANIVHIDYRVQPEHKYPSALEDAVKGWDWLLEQGYKEEDIVVVGDSAGGHLAVSLVLKLKELGKKLPKGLICMSPWLDMLGEGESYRTNYNVDVMFGRRGELPSEETIQNLLEWDLYKWFDEQDRKNPYITPLYGDFSNFPSTLIITGGAEMLLSDSEALARKIKEAGGDVTFKIEDGMFHVFPLMQGITPESKRAFESIKQFMVKMFK